MTNRWGTDILELLGLCHKCSGCILVCCNNLCQAGDTCRACDDTGDCKEGQVEEDEEGHGGRRGGGGEEGEGGSQGKLAPGTESVQS